MVRERASVRLADLGYGDEERERILDAVPIATHNQRGEATLMVGSRRYIEAGRLIDVADSSMSAPIFALLKRPDELYVVEQAHLHPRFVEDSVRCMVAGVLEAEPELEDDAFLLARQVNFETIHTHDVIAERTGLRRRGPRARSPAATAATTCRSRPGSRAPDACAGRLVRELLTAPDAIVHDPRTRSLCAQREHPREEPTMALGTRGRRAVGSGAAGVLVAAAVAAVGVTSPASRAAGADTKIKVPVLKVGNGHDANMGLEAPGGKQVASVTWALGGDIVKFDPAFAYDYNSTPVVSQGCEGLLRYNNANGTLLPNLASSWSSPNPTTYVYDVRQGVKFWDGTPMTVADVLWSMNRIMNPEDGARTRRSTTPT